MRRLIYTICSKNLTNKFFVRKFSVNERKFIKCKEAQNIWKKFLVLGSNKYTQKFQPNVYDANCCLQTLETNFSKF